MKNLSYFLIILSCCFSPWFCLFSCFSHCSCHSVFLFISLIFPRNHCFPDFVCQPNLFFLFHSPFHLLYYLLISWIPSLLCTLFNSFLFLCCFSFLYTSSFFPFPFSSAPIFVHCIPSFLLFLFSLLVCDWQLNPAQVSLEITLCVHVYTVYISLYIQHLCSSVETVNWSVKCKLPADSTLRSDWLRQELHYVTSYFRNQRKLRRLHSCGFYTVCISPLTTSHMY